ncbi:hypothetical protein GGR88_002165 [Sphingomonas jejuensis]|uniref:Uncharacterized protein n=1 Tax=Sphingomonas jejuensis TaxID=904715 RepID=A0ABX0XPL7_9SPHN|nr:hypothetical protein [Sphingomonas jejuensis]NJC34651.1 hypothetical protein [Sphingomonas jejuensis]
MADNDDTTPTGPDAPARRPRKSTAPKSARAPRAAKADAAAPKSTRSKKAADAPKPAPRRKAAARKATAKGPVATARKSATKAADRVGKSARNAAEVIADTAKKPGVIAALVAGAGAAIAAGAVLYSRSRPAKGGDASTRPGQEGHAVPDLASDKPHNGPADRAPDAFRPDPTAGIPDGDRSAFAPALVKDGPPSNP